MPDFYKRLSYSIGNEDWKTEKNALHIQPQDRILSVTASGDRPLNLLYSECKEIISIDANPFQTALCDLKRAAIDHLDYDAYLSFLGVKPCPVRLKLLPKLENSMDAGSVNCWREHHEKIKEGILYQGAVEKWLQLASKLISMTGRAKIDRLFSFDELEHQKLFVEKKWNSRIWQAIVAFALNPLFARFVIKDPGLYAHIDPQISVGNYIYSRLERSLKRFLAKENILVSLILQGKVYKEGLSPYLNEEGFDVIKKRLHRLKLINGNVINYLEKAPDASIDCFSLSDIASYMSQDDFHRMCRALYRAAKPGARFCIRQLMSSHDFPEELRSHMIRNPLLEEQLEQEDRCFVYRFTVGKVLKP